MLKRVGACWGMRRKQTRA